MVGGARLELPSVIRSSPSDENVEYQEVYLVPCSSVRMGWSNVGTEGETFSSSFFFIRVGSFFLGRKFFI